MINKNQAWMLPSKCEIGFLIMLPRNHPSSVHCQTPSKLVIRRQGVRKNEEHLNKGLFYFVSQDSCCWNLICRICFIRTITYNDCTVSSWSIKNFSECEITSSKVNCKTSKTTF
jgi:hypothetical protein